MDTKINDIANIVIGDIWQGWNVIFTGGIFTDCSPYWCLKHKEKNM